jgi:hypothetical protein
VDSTGRIRYPPSGVLELGRWFLIGLVGVFVVSVVAVWSFAALLPRPGLSTFAIFWTLIVAWNVYRFARGSLELSLDSEYLEWRGLFFRGKTPVSTLQRVRPSRFEGILFQLIERSNGRPIVIWVRRGDSNFRAFCLVLQERNPSLYVRPV